MGRDVNKLKAKGGGKFKYMSEKEMLELAAKFAPYRYVHPGLSSFNWHKCLFLIVWQKPFYVVYVAD